MSDLMQRIQRGIRHLPPRFLIYGTEGIGKAQPLDARVLTPHGFVNMGDLKVGDLVIGSDGRPHLVLGVYPQGEKEVFRVTFRDGSTTRCCDNHLWFTQTRKERDRGLRGAVRSLRDIRRSLRYGTHFNHGVPRVQPVEFDCPPQNLPIDPWLLGMYLGDGCSNSSVIITNQEPDVQAKIAESLHRDDECVHTSPDEGALRIKCRQGQQSPSQMMLALRELGVCGLESQDKFVPSPYLHASVQVRLSLLQGLFDSDGFVTNPGSVEYCTTSPRLAEDVCFLIRSLGGSARTVAKPKPAYTHRGQKKVGRPAYRIFCSFPSGLVPVSTEKHLARWGEPQWAIRHTIRSIESIGTIPCQCIRIDAPDSLYVTDDFILTHNSTIASRAPHPIFLQTEDGLDQIDCSSFPLATSYREVIDALAALYTETHDYETVVIDSLDWLERLVWDEVCREYGVKSIEKVDGGYAKGYTHALTQWREVLDGLDALRNERGMAVVLLAHAKVEKFDDPESVAYDRYSPRLHKHASAMITEWCDAVLFATRKFRTESEEAGFNRTRSIAVALGRDGGERVLRCVGCPSCIAKNRFNLPPELPLSWPDLMAAMTNQSDPSTTTTTSINGESTDG